MKFGQLPFCSLEQIGEDEFRIQPASLTLAAGVRDIRCFTTMSIGIPKKRISAKPGGLLG